MAKKVWEVVAAGGKYTKNGETKIRWINCGSVFENEKGLSMKLDSLPLSFGEDGLWLKFFEPRDVQNGPTSKPSPQRRNDDMDDEPVPF